MLAEKSVGKKGLAKKSLGVAAAALLLASGATADGAASAEGDGAAARAASAAADGAGAASAVADNTAPPGGTIAFALTSLYWAVYVSADGKTECPAGFNDGNREQFQQLFPNDGAPRTVLDTQLRREIDSWYPTTAPEPFVFHEAGGPTSYGLNLDGKVGPNDFTSPEGEPGIDNQLYRAVGCINGYRQLDTTPQGSDNMAVRNYAYNRIIIQLTGVHSLVNDDAVNVTVYRGRDPVPLDATGKNAIPGRFQRIDTRWGARYIQHLHGRITHGVLTTEPADLVYPWAALAPVPTDEYMYGARLKLKLSATGAEGLIGGYSDIESWYSQLMRSWATHYQSYGQLSAPSIYKALRRLADGHPDPQTGANTAISSALLAKFTAVLLDPASLTQVDAAQSLRPKVPFAGPPFQRAAAEEVYAGFQATSSP